MTTIGRLEGRGALIVNGKERAEVQYALDIRSDGKKARDAIGSIQIAKSETFHALLDAFSSGDVQLRLAEGEHVGIVIERMGTAGFVPIRTRGPIPSV